MKQRHLSRQSENWSFSMIYLNSSSDTLVCALYIFLNFSTLCVLRTTPTKQKEKRMSSKEQMKSVNFTDEVCKP